MAMLFAFLDNARLHFERKKLMSDGVGLPLFDRCMEGSLEARLVKGDYWQAASNAQDPPKVADGQSSSCVISFVDTQGKRYLVCHFDFDWIEGFLDVLASLVAHNTEVLELGLQDPREPVLPQKYKTTAGWIACQVLKRCPPMLVLSSDQPNAYETAAKRYVTALIDNEACAPERILRVFEWQGPGRSSRCISMADLVQRWKLITARLATSHTTMESTWLCDHVLRGC